MESIRTRLNYGSVTIINQGRTLKGKFEKTLFTVFAIFAIVFIPTMLTADAYALETAPNFTLTDIDGKRFSLTDYRGKVVLLEFFFIR